MGARGLLAAGCALLLGLTAGCGGPGAGGPADAPIERVEATLRVLAGSELADMGPVLAELEAETGVRLELEYEGTLQATKELISDDEGGWDLAWLPSGRYLSLLPESEGLVSESASIMRSPVVLGLKPEAAASLGWSEQSPPEWQEVLDAAAAGRLRFGMTNPVASNSGFLTLLQSATALSGNGTALQRDDVAAVSPQLGRLAAGHALTSGSSGWLLESFQEDPEAVDGLFAYESTLRGVQLDGAPLTLLIPSDGVITSDYPLMLLDGADETTQRAYRAAVDYLSRAEVQQRIADTTGRRTSATPPEADARVFELPFPANVETVHELLSAWLSSIKKPSDMVFGIDTSGSMGEGDRMQQLRNALAVLTGEREPEGGGFLRLQPRERITLLEFGEATKSHFTVEVPADAAGRTQAMAQLAAYIDGFVPEGDTSIYSTAQQAYERALVGAAEGRLASIVLFTDGENTAGTTRQEFEAWHAAYAAQNPGAADIPVHTIVFGEADAEAMAALSELTGGRSFDARTAPLDEVFEEIRGYL